MMTKRYISLALLSFVFIFAASCGPAGDPASTPEPLSSAGGAVLPTSTPIPAESPGSDPLQPPDPLYQAVRQLSTEEKVGQLLVVGITGTSPARDALWAIQEARVGGIVLFGRNISDAAQLLELINGLKELNRAAENTPLFLCVDEEGGMVSRMPDEVADIPSAFEGPDPCTRGELLAAECAAFGFNLDFAPVLDTWSNPDNTVIGKRAFHTDFLETTIAGTGCAYAMMASGVIPVVKHFPGHGDTDTDSHVGLPVVDKTRQELEDAELMPFRFAIDGAEWKPPVEREPTPVPAVMVAHILMTQLDADRPASLSPAVVDGLLREELGFDGVVFTDDLTMGAITNTYGVGEAAVLAIEAGCDVALVCHGLEQAQDAYAALLEAVNSGRISMSRLDDSVTRILALKLNGAYAVNDAPVPEPDLNALNARIEKALASYFPT